MARTATVLLVEDDEAVRQIISAVLLREGFRLTDVIMPEMNGPALAQRFVTERPELRVLFFSSYADEPASLGRNHGHAALLSKPFQASMLVQRVRQILARRGGVEEHR